MPKRKCDDAETGRTFSVKCSLGRLLVPCSSDPELAELEHLEISRKLRTQIETSVERIHALAVKGTLVATDVLLRAAREGRPLPPVDEQSWWYKCLTSCGKLKGTKRASKDGEIERSAQALFSATSDWTEMDHLWPFIAEMARDFRTVCHNMVASSFHNQILKAFRREVILWEELHGQSLPKDKVFKIVDHFARLVTGHEKQRTLSSDDVPEELGVQLKAMVRSWKNRFSDVLPCPHSSFISNLPSKELPKLRKFLEWMHEMQVHRASCIQALQEALPPSSLKTAEHIFSASGKAQGLLPVASFKVKCIAIPPTGLKSLLAAAGLPETMTFDNCFPGISRFLKAGRISSGDYIRTDGISASMTLRIRTVEEASPPLKKKKGGRKGSEKVSSDLRPIMPLPGQKLVAVDPGRREMIYAVTEDDACNKGLSMSTRCFRHQAGLSASTNMTIRKQKDALCSDGTSVYEKLTSLPSRKNIYEWDEFLSALIPHLSSILLVRCSRCLRRRAFRSYMLRDKALDGICKSLTSGSEGLTLVAFGGANSCSTGFGHAPAPQGRLRFRLSKHHNARVCIVDEFRTSRYCHKCSSRLEHAVGMDRDTGKKVKIHHVLCCPTCTNSKGHKQFWHRDFNAAKNILSCYIAEAQGQIRPQALQRQIT